MWCSVGLIGLLLSSRFQVPAPAPGTEAAHELESARRSILAREAAELSSLAEQFGQEGEDRRRPAGSRADPPAGRADGPTRFVPLPEVVERPVLWIDDRSRSGSERDPGSRRRRILRPGPACRQVGSRVSMPWPACASARSGAAARSQGGAAAPGLCPA